MNEVAVGYLRLILYLITILFFDVPSLREIEFWISDLLHGNHLPDSRESAAVNFVMLAVLSLMAFYIFQTVIYIFLGSALKGRNSGILNLFRHVLRSFKGLRTKSHFWTSEKECRSNFRNIDELLSYRDNKMAFMRNSEAAELLKKASHVDTLRSSSNLPQSKKTLSYLNNKIALMDNKQALDYIQNK